MNFFSKVYMITVQLHFCQPVLLNVTKSLANLQFYFSSHSQEALAQSVQTADWLADIVEVDSVEV